MPYSTQAGEIRPVQNGTLLIFVWNLSRLALFLTRVRMTCARDCHGEYNMATKSSEEASMSLMSDYILDCRSSKLGVAALLYSLDIKPTDLEV